MASNQELNPTLCEACRRIAVTPSGEDRSQLDHCVKHHFYPDGIALLKSCETGCTLCLQVKYCFANKNEFLNFKRVDEIRYMVDVSIDTRLTLKFEMTRPFHPPMLDEYLLGDSDDSDEDEDDDDDAKDDDRNDNAESDRDNKADEQNKQVQSKDKQGKEEGNDKQIGEEARNAKLKKKLLSTIYFGISKPPDDYEIVPADMLGPSTSSEVTLNQARNWIENCVENHKICRQDSVINFLPTRLLDIGEAGQELDLVYLRMTDEFPPSTKYMTLSHRWGTAEFLKLTTKTLSLLINGIHVTELLPKFKDAIHIARSVGVRYMWIDSLCIFQDSGTDWSQEATLMYSVYKHSYCNIAVAIDEDNPQGITGCFVDNRNHVEISPFYMHFDTEGLHLQGKFVIQKSESLFRAEIFGRGWVVQERVLSCRILHFTTEKVFFECYCGVSRESVPKTISEEQDYILEAKKMIRKAEILDKSEEQTKRHMLHTAWTLLLHGYTSCDLTVETDKLIALSGLAKYVQPLLGSNYLAGLWEQDLAFHMLWYNLGAPDDPEQVHPYIAPSWSWASTSSDVYLYNFKEYDDLTPVGDILIEILEAKVSLATSDQTGQVTNGHIKLRGLLRSVGWMHRTGHYEDTVLVIDGEETWVNLFRDDEKDDLSQDLWCLPIFRSPLPENRYDGNVELLGLALERVKHSSRSGDVYRRVGYFEASQEEYLYFLKRSRREKAKQQAKKTLAGLNTKWKKFRRYVDSDASSVSSTESDDSIDKILRGKLSKRESVITII